MTRARELSIFFAIIGICSLGCASSSPLPDLHVRADMAMPVRGGVVITATPIDFSPSRVEFYLDDTGGDPVHMDHEPPFAWPLETESLGDGVSTVVVLAYDDHGSIRRQLSLEVRNRPNIVFLFVDDLDEMQSPYLDAMPNTATLLANQGLRFSNSFAPSPSCAPARALTLTGRYAHNNGVYDQSPPDGGYDLFRDTQEQDTIATRLRDAGYRNAFLGKYINGYYHVDSHIPAGWDEWFGLTHNRYSAYDYEASHNGALVAYGDAPEDYQTDVISELAQDFIDAGEADDDRPFFLMIAPVAPHVPLEPAPRHLDHPWVTATLPSWPNFNEPDASDKPTWLRDGLLQVGFGVTAFITADYRNRMGSLMAVDDMVGALVDKLIETDELEQTVFVFTSDNGYSLGAHRVTGKGVPYEESIRTPLIVAGRDVRIGSEVRAVNQTDLAPTFLDLAGAEHGDLDGFSMVPLFTDSPTAWRSDQLFEINGTLGGAVGNHDTFEDVLAAIDAGTTRMRSPSYRALRTETELYVQWYRGDFHEYELYDLNVDPYQLDNLLATPAGELEHAMTTTALQARLEELIDCTGQTCR